jgi:hypothetical protein
LNKLVKQVRDAGAQRAGMKPGYYWRRRWELRLAGIRLRASSARSALGRCRIQVPGARADSSASACRMTAGTGHELAFQGKGFAAALPDLPKQLTR